MLAVLYDESHVQIKSLGRRNLRVQRLDSSNAFSKFTASSTNGFTSFSISVSSKFNFWPFSSSLSFFFMHMYFFFPPTSTRKTLKTSPSPRHNTTIMTLIFSSTFHHLHRHSGSIPDKWSQAFFSISRGCICGTGFTALANFTALGSGACRMGIGNGVVTSRCSCGFVFYGLGGMDRAIGLVDRLGGGCVPLPDCYFAFLYLALGRRVRAMSTTESASRSEYTVPKLLLQFAHVSVCRDIICWRWHA